MNFPDVSHPGYEQGCCLLTAYQFIEPPRLLHSTCLFAVYSKGLSQTPISPSKIFGKRCFAVRVALTVARRCPGNRRTTKRYKYINDTVVLRLLLHLTVSTLSWTHGQDLVPLHECRLTRENLSYMQLFHLKMALVSVTDPSPCSFNFWQYSFIMAAESGLTSFSYCS